MRRVHLGTILVPLVLGLAIVGGCGTPEPSSPATASPGGERVPSPMACGGVACDYVDPWAPGPYPVGVRDALYFDETREALSWRGCAGGPPCPRPIRVSIWYPAAEAARSMPRTQLADFLEVTAGTLHQILVDLVEAQGWEVPDVEISTRELASVKDAPLRPGGRWPVVIFSHGAGGVRFQSLFLTEYLASHGFVVVAPDHEGDATVTVIQGEVVTAAFRNFPVSALERPLDVQFLIDRLRAHDADPNHWLHGALAIAPGVGLTGHSFGAYTSITVAGLDDRVRAIVPQAAPGLSAFAERVPTFFMIAGEDDTIERPGNDMMRAQFEIAPVPKAWLDLLDAGHFTYSNMCDLVPDFGDGCGTGRRITTGEPLTYVDPELAHPLIAGFTTAWFGAYLKGDPRYLEDLAAPPTTTVRYRYERYE